MDDFTQRLLEKKNARKRKQEEASAALKSIDLQQSAHRSPEKTRYPLSAKNDNDTVGAKLPPVAKPRTDNGLDKKATPTKRRTSKSPGRDLEEILDSGRKSQIFANSKHGANEMQRGKPKTVTSESDSVQGRVARLQSDSSTHNEGRSPRSRQASISRNNSTETPPSKNDRTPGSISDRLAMFEKSRTSSQARVHHSKSSEQKSRPPSGTVARTSEGDSSRQRLSAKLQKTSTMRECVTKSETFTPLSPKLESISAVDESCDFDYQSDENPFDVSSILRAANEGESHAPEAVEYSKASWDVLDYLMEESPKTKVIDKGSKRDSTYSNGGDGEVMSGFGKEIAKKRNALKSPNQQENLKKIDSNLNERALHSAKSDERGIKKGKVAPGDEIRARERTPKSESMHSKLGRKDEKRKAPKFPGDENASDSQSRLKKQKRAEKPAAVSASDDARDDRQAPPKPPRKGKLSVEEPQEGALIEQGSEGDVVMDELKISQSTEKRDEYGPSYVVCKDTSDAKKSKEKKRLTSDCEMEKQKFQEEVSKKTELDVVSVMTFSPNPKTCKSVREKKLAKGRKGMRRSVSFSEGQSPVVPIIHKSGYNEEASSKYNVVTYCGTVLKDKEKSASDQIKDLLDYAVSQQNIVIQASQALNLSLNGEEKRGCPEIIEGERLLLLATQRRTACLEEVESLKQPGNTGRIMKDDSACPPCKATLHITDINLPLNGDFLVALRGGRMDLGVFHFVVLIQHGPTQIYSTKVRCTYDEFSRNFLTFKDKITLKEVSHDFALKIKVFGMHTKRATDVIYRGKKSAQAKESPGLMKNVFSSLTPKRRLHSADDSPVRGSSPKPVFRTTNFTAVGSSHIDLTNCGAGKFVLNQVPKNCPLDGFIDLKIDCLPEFTASARGFLTLLEEVGGFTAWNRRWCVMQGDLISFWRFPDEENQKPPTATIDLRMCTNKIVDVVPRMECSRPNTFELNVKRPLSKHDAPSLLSTIEGKDIHTKHWVSADNKEDRAAWIEVLNRQLSDSKAWSIKGFKGREKATSHASPRKQQRGAVPV